MEQRFKLCGKAVMQDLETNFNAEECCILWVNYLEYLCASGQKDKVIPLVLEQIDPTLTKFIEFVEKKYTDMDDTLSSLNVQKLSFLARLLTVYKEKKMISEGLSLSK